MERLSGEELSAFPVSVFYWFAALHKFTCNFSVSPVKKYTTN